MSTAKAQRVTTAMHVDRDGVAIRIDIAGDYYEGEASSAGPDDPHPGCAAFWGELTDEERSVAEAILIAEAEKDMVVW